MAGRTLWAWKAVKSLRQVSSAFYKALWLLHGEWEEWAEE